MAKSIKAQAGPQTEFLTSKADIVIYGGEAGGAKTYSLLMEASRNIAVKGSQSIIFRRESTQIRDGGMWDEAFPIFKAMGCKHNEQSLRFNYPQGGFLKFSHMQYDKDRFKQQGKQWGFIGFDEVQHFTETQFYYMMSRNRSTVVKPYMRATCNPDPDSFLVNGAKGWGSGLISWWIDDDGFPIPERSGKIRYFCRSKDGKGWDYDSDRDELVERHYDAIRARFDKAQEGLEDGEELWTWEEFIDVSVKSLTFIKSSVYDNKELLRENPEYLADLANLDEVERARLEGGNWKIKNEGSIFKRKMFKTYEGDPWLQNCMIFADTAQSTEETAAYTVFLLAGYTDKGIYILDVYRDRPDVDELPIAAKAFWKRHNKVVNSNMPPAVMRIENKSSGIGLNQQLRKAKIPIDPVSRGGKPEDGEKPAGKKWERAVNSVYALDGRKIYLPSEPNQYTDDISWVEPFETELLAAERQGDAKGKWDQVDCFTDAVTQFFLIGDDDWAV